MSVSVNGKAVPEADYERTDKKLTISNLPQGKFDLEIVVDIKPQVNRANFAASPSRSSGALSLSCC